MNREEFKIFALELKEKMPAFIKSMEDYQILGKYRFSFSGDIPSQNIHWGLGQSTFVARILYIFDSLDNTISKNLANYIKSFQRKDGAINDDYVSSSTLFHRFLRSVKNLTLEYITNAINKRAETRQAIAALINLGYDYGDYKDLDLKNLDVNKYFNKFDWSKPWSAGSHINHLIFFTKYSKSLNGENKKAIYREIHKNLTQYIQKDGFYKTDSKVSINQKIGGLMKILMGLSLINKEKEFIQKSFIDFALDEMIACDACENFNTLYVLYYCNKHLDYRREDIKKFALNEVLNWMNYYYEDLGAYSFYQRKASTVYYGAKMSKGLDEPDLHGSAMFAWGILLVAEILGLKEELGLREPVL